jgi:hypothetical protein
LVCIVPPAADWRTLIAPALVLISTAVAVLALITTKRIARRKATLDLIEKVESTEHYRSLNATFSRLRRGRGFAHLADPLTPQDEADRARVNDYLNHYELVSVGIFQRILDEAFYRTWMRAPFVRDWNAAVDFVQRERWRRGPDGAWTYNARIYCNYQRMARRWSREALNLTADYGGGAPGGAGAGPGDEALPGAG